MRDFNDRPREVRGWRAIRLPGAGNKTMPELEERTFHREEENGPRGKYAELNTEENRGGGQRDVVSRTKLHNEMDHELLDKIRAVGNARDEGGAGNLSLTKLRLRTHGADQKRGHAESYER